MSLPLPGDLDSQLLDDFFGEADEHLVSIRQRLLQLEASIGKAQPEAKVVDELFRAFHSFKGISAIVGLAPAESLTHATEDYLRLIRDGKASLTSKGLEVLTAAAQKLEQVVAAFRAGKPLPGYESLLEALKDRAAEHSTMTSSAAVRTSSLDTALLNRIEEARSRGLLLWRYTFTPNRDLDAAGININAIRDQLSKFGEILKATPQVEGKSSVVFEFLVAARESLSDLAAWEAKGVTVQPAELEPADSPPALGGPGSFGEVEHSPFLAPSHVVRVDLKLLDDLMRITGEMVIHRSRLDAQLARVKDGSTRVDVRGVQEVSGGLGRSLRELREAIMRVRLVPVAEIFGRMPFVVRDLGRQTQKKVRLRLAGQETAIDKYVIERLKDPLLHLVRNAFSHGVETAQERAASGKTEEATIDLKASTVGDSVVIQVVDDGKGINPHRVVERARKLGLAVPELIDNDAILQILCSAGFSTRDDADRASGRGVGMGVVNATVRELGGSLSLDSEEGRGTRFTIRLPLTLAIAETLIVTAAGQKCAIPQNFVREIFQASEQQLQTANGIEVIPYRGGVLPVMRLSSLFGLRGEPLPKMCLLVVTSDRGSIGLIVEQVLGQKEVVVSALHDPLIQVTGISGATELGDGKAVLILDGTALTRGAVRPPERGELKQEERYSMQNSV